jgi:hypothetical protein
MVEHASAVPRGRMSMWLSSPSLDESLDYFQTTLGVKILAVFNEFERRNVGNDKLGTRDRHGALPLVIACRSRCSRSAPQDMKRSLGQEKPLP